MNVTVMDDEKNLGTWDLYYAGQAAFESVLESVGENYDGRFVTIEGYENIYDLTLIRQVLHAIMIARFHTESGSETRSMIRAAVHKLVRAKYHVDRVEELWERVE